jgi:hypothetical protein
MSTQTIPIYYGSSGGYVQDISTDITPVYAYTTTTYTPTLTYENLVRLSPTGWYEYIPTKPKPKFIW